MVIVLQQEIAELGIGFRKIRIDGDHVSECHDRFAAKPLRLKDKPLVELSDGHCRVDLDGVIEAFDGFGRLVGVEIGKAKIIVGSSALGSEFDCCFQRRDRFIVLAVLPQQLGELDMGIDMTRLQLKDLFHHLDSAPGNAEPAGNRGEHQHACNVIRLALQNLAAPNLGLVEIPLAIGSHRFFEQLIEQP